MSLLCDRVAVRHSLAYEQRLLPRYITQQVYTTAWQEIVKPKALELRVLRVIVRTITSYCIGKERSDRAQFMRRTYVLLAVQAISTTQGNSSQQYLCCGNVNRG